jgi:DNA-binding NarL/FixJ family response regulator
VRVVLVEDHPMMRAAIETVLQRADFEIAGAASSAAEGYDLVGATSPDVVVVDLGLPDENGVELTRRLLQRNGKLAVVIHTGMEDPVALKDALTCGARGFAYKTGGPAHLVKAVRAAAAGDLYVAPELRAAIAATARSDGTRVLSDRERQVLALVADGATNDEIAGKLFLSPETIRTHIRNAMRKLGAHTRAHAVAEALRGEEIRL